MKKTVLKLLIATFIISALLGIGIITFEIWSVTTLKILLTTTTLFISSIPLICCISLNEKKPKNVISLAGIIASTITCFYIVLLIWGILDVDILDLFSYRFISVGATISFSAGHLCLLEGINNQTKPVKYVKKATIICSLFIDLMIIIQVLFEVETITKLNIIIVILVVLGTIITPLISKVTNTKTTENNQNQPDKYKQLEQLKQLLDNNTLTQQEFEQEKQKILNQ